MDISSSPSRVGPDGNFTAQARRSERVPTRRRPIERRGRRFVDDRAFVTALAPVGDGDFHLGAGPLGPIRAEDAGDGDEIYIGEHTHVELVVLEKLHELAGRAFGKLVLTVTPEKAI